MPFGMIDRPCSRFRAPRLSIHREKADKRLSRHCGHEGARFVQKARAGPGYRHLRVGLSGAQPHFAHKYIVYADAISGKDTSFGAGRHWSEMHCPASVLTGNRRNDLIAERHLYALASFCRPPDRHRHITLKNTSIRKRRDKLDTAV